ncbi:MAG: type I-F CRISPR-associated protein Csy1 [Gammaproteobacteria bacterium RIFOXYA12_FULL_61_12]|nr:MAG: type I-F CRISPR-associated protein Csy1 [Gammaproteobacteria bacterium RIFOXYA12_FULL_61_12]OGT88534.1 MAG: type I-F CRISPR-associated protein Csy1 [Gammaproteobacteria bacterium RIFOXYD12_FULL_61_37]
MNDAPLSPSPPGESQRIKAEIARFLREDRLQPKLEKLKADDDEARQKLIDEHQPAAWIADAAHRVGQIQQVTHAIKFTHPSADGSSLSSPGNPAAEPLELGSHSLAGEWSADVVGNAAALDVYKFLRLSVDGRSLLDRATARDPALAEALSDDAAQAAEWLAAFAALPEAKGGPSSHKLAKQLYWPLEDGGYHLLAPLLSSPLAHAVHERIAEDRFSDAAKAARDARRANKPHAHGYRDYPNLAIQNFGGSKPQNISQLNSERRGENYLLASVPPIWESSALRPPLKTDTVFARYFGSRSEVRRLVAVLKDFLLRVADAGTNIRIRETRAELVADLCGEALNMAAELRELEPGWSAHANCQLNLAEQCWLDPDRALSDEDFAARYRQGDWKDEVCLRFANWLNAALKTDKTLLGGPEALVWQAVLGNELKMLREELEDE